jgi:hypothetical protein
LNKEGLREEIKTIEQNKKDRGAKKLNPVN